MRIALGFVAIAATLIACGEGADPVHDTSRGSADDDSHCLRQQSITKRPPGPGHGPAPKVSWVAARERDAVLIFVHKDGIQSGTQVLGSPSWLPAILPVGSYRAIARLGNDCASQEFTVSEGRCTPDRLEFDRLEPGHGVIVRVLRDGEPVAGAEVSCDSFNGARNGIHVNWGTTDADGLFLLSGLPVDIRSVYAGAMEGGRGRNFEAPLGGRAGVVVVDIGG